MEYKKKTERNIWLTVPTNKLYVRNPDSLITHLELEAISKKYDKIDGKDMKPVPVKDNSKKDDKEGQSVKGEKKKDDKGKENEGKKSKKQKTLNFDEEDQDANPEKYLKIQLDVLNPSKSKDKNQIS